MRKRKFVPNDSPSTTMVKRRKPTAKDRSRSRMYRSVNVVRGRGPVAAKTIVKLKYADGFTSASTPIDYVFNLNSLFDPNFTSTGHQPYGRDTYATLYNRYRVFRTDYIISCSSLASTTTATYRVIVGANNTQTAYTSADTAAESPNFRTFHVQGASTSIMIKGSYYLPSLTGVTPKQYASDDRFQALMSADPAESLCLHVVNSTTAGDTSPGAGTLVYNITLIFHCELFDPLELSAS